MEKQGPRFRLSAIDATLSYELVAAVNACQNCHRTS
jgi:hypothetical protein